MTGLDEKLTKVRKPIYNSMLKKGESLNSFVNRTIDET